MTHTPGPWRVLPLNWGWQVLAYPWARRPTQAKVLAAVGGHTDDPREDKQGHADAMLMAAAPDLLAACEDALAWLEEYGTASGPLGTGEEHDLRTALQNAVALARGDGQ